MEVATTGRQDMDSASPCSTVALYGHRAEPLVRLGQRSFKATGITALPSHSIELAMLGTPARKATTCMAITRLTGSVVLSL